MAANQVENSTVNTPFPNPPAYWQSFTTENLANYESLRSTTDPDAVPHELENLRPPTPPVNGEYSIFGEKRALTAPLKDLPEETPFLQPVTGSGSSPQHLFNLTRSLMLSYLELLNIMAVNPEPPIYGSKWEDLRDLFKNIHYGLNTYRPWQARDALIRLLEQTRDDARAEIEGVKNLKTKIDKVLEGVAQNCEIIAGSDERIERDPYAMKGVESSNHTNGKVRGLSNANSDNRLAWILMSQDVEE